MSEEMDKSRIERMWSAYKRLKSIARDNDVVAEEIRILIDAINDMVHVCRDEKVRIFLVGLSFELDRIYDMIPFLGDRE